MPKRKLTDWDSAIEDPWTIASAARPLSYFEAAYEEDEVSLFWSSVLGAAATGTFIGTWLGAGGSAAFGGYGAYSMMMRYHPLTMVGVYLPYYSIKKQIEIHGELDEMHPDSGAGMSMSTRFAGAGAMTGGSMPVMWGLPGYDYHPTSSYHTQQGKTFLEDLWMTATGGV